jgi:alkaline phosphatase D
MEANIWMQTKKQASVKVVYWNAETPDLKLQTTAVKATPENSFVVAKKLKHLAPGATYIYEIAVDGKKVKTPYVLKFKTQTLYQHRVDAPNFSFALGSCAFVNDAPYDRPGEPYGGDYEIFGTVRKQNPELMLWLGDNIYQREAEFYSRARIDYRYTYTRELKEMQELLASTVNIATWDDHDYGPNDSDRSFRNKLDALELFKRYWINPQYGIEGTPGVFGRYLYNDVEFFLMDDRYHRAPNESTDPDKAYWGVAQTEWLKDALLSSKATFKFIVNGNQVINAHSKHETYFHYTGEYNRFMKWLTEAKISGVLFLSGDRHHTELLKLDREGSYPLYEFTSSPLTSKVYTDSGDEINNPMRVPKTLVNNTRNFGVIRVEGNRNNRTLILQTFDVKGNLIWDQRIDASQLKAQ